MLNRFHNYVVEQLAVINENGRFNKPDKAQTHEFRDSSWQKYDEDLFQVRMPVLSSEYNNHSYFLDRATHHLWSVHEHHLDGLPAYDREP